MVDPKSSRLRPELRNPAIAPVGLLNQSVEDIKALADTGLGAVAIFSLSEEQLLRDVERLMELEKQPADMTPEAISLSPEVPRAEVDAVTNYLRLVEKGVQTIDVPLIASFNGTSRRGQVHSMHSLQDAGAAVLEFSTHCAPGDPTLGGEEVEQRHLDILRAMRSEVNTPVAAELSSYFPSVNAMCQRLDRAGADGLVLLNRFLQPDIDLDRLEVVSGVTLSSLVDVRLSRTQITVLRDRVETSLAVSSGVDQPGDVAKYLPAGADVIYIASALMRHGVEHATRLVKGPESRLDGRRFTLDQIRGVLTVPGHTPADTYEYTGYVIVLEKTKTAYGSLS